MRGVSVSSKKAISNLSMSELNENELAVKNHLPRTARDLSTELGFSISYIYDLIGILRRKGHSVEQNSDGEYFIGEGGGEETQPTGNSTTRATSSSKASITREAKEMLAEMEGELIDSLSDTDPQLYENTPQQAGNQDLIIHRTDDHFGELTSNQHGDTVYDSEIAAERVNRVFDEAHRVADMREAAGVEFDTANLLLGGDIITGESIYEGQPHEIDETLYEQIHRASEVYTEAIRDLSDRFPAVRVACQPGNHGRLGHGNPTNADSILYMMLDKIVRESDMENITFLQSERSYYIDFSIRDWNVHLRHGHDSGLGHIGTSAAKSRWRSWLIDHGFDLAFRGHNHQYKDEPINGIPVIMGGSIVPQTEFEESHAMSGRPMGAIHGSSDDHAHEWTEKVFFD